MDQKKEIPLIIPIIKQLQLSDDGWKQLVAFVALISEALSSLWKLRKLNLKKGKKIAIAILQFLELFMAHDIVKWFFPFL